MQWSIKRGEKKCARLHIEVGNVKNCPLIFVNGKLINESEKEKYLGDYLTKHANPKATIQGVTNNSVFEYYSNSWTK